MSPPVWQFEWDEHKARSNQAKHDVGFPLAMSVFRDPNAITLYDDDHSTHEERWITLGLASNGQTLVVVHTYQQTHPAAALIRIISARKANRAERDDYLKAPP